MTIDWWTLGIQAVNVAILIWLLSRFFWRPVAAMIEQRRKTAEKMLSDSEAKRKESDAALAAIEQTRAGFEKEREAILAAAQEDAKKARSAMLEQAAKDAASLKKSAQASIAQEKEQAEKEWSACAGRLAVSIAGRLVRRFDQSSIRAAFLDQLAAELQALPEASRRLMAGKALKVVSATPLPGAEQDRCRSKVNEVLGVNADIAFDVDADLIAGLELHAPHFVVSNSWRADLGRILAEIDHDA